MAFRTVYSLRTKLERNPKYVAEVQARSLDNRTLPGGLKGTHGLFGTQAWWASVENGALPVILLEGVIGKVYLSGMENNSHDFEMWTDDGATYRYTCVADAKTDKKSYVPGRKIRLRYAVEELKIPISGPSGPIMYTDTILEIALDETTPG